jgi:hypothetical protein
MEIFAACWQDPYEPWGWAPDSLWATREAAEQRMNEMIDNEIMFHARLASPSEDDLDEIRRQYSVRTYMLDQTGDHWTDHA